MQTKRNNLYLILPRFIFIPTLISILVSCQLSPVAVESTASEPVSSGPTAPTLSGTFQTELINPLDIPHTYVEETCRYLKNKWNPLNAQPGTVVMVIMIKNITPGPTEEADSISGIEFMDLMNQLRAQGFKAINTDLLQAFMERNVWIPPRSVVLIQDGNRPAEYYDRYYREYFDNWEWSIVNGWISEEGVDPTLLADNFQFEYEGFIDHQARGINPETTLSDDSSKIIIARELQGSRSGFAEQFGKTPNSIIWPNGGFGFRPIEAARQLRFKLGFTQNPRGPIMYNWVPLADDIDPERPNLIPEGRIVDPLMTLPTYPAENALLAIDVTRAIGKQAAAYEQSNKDLEHKYYEIVCEEEYGPMPTP